MDLRGILNDSAPAAATPSKPPPPPMMMPSTPVQTNPHQAFRDYSQTHPSPGRHMSMDYSMQQAPPPGAYASPPPTRRAPQPPPLQQISANDIRSPTIASGPGPSPYRQTPTSSISASSGGGYPFPAPQMSTSPVQQHRYPPQAPYHRDTFPQPSLPGGMTGPPGGVSYMQAGPQVPQTPPVVTPGGHGYPHQRSQSTHSTPTPTSAHSQQAQYGAPFLHGSPVAVHHSLPHMDPPSRHSSQPPTPVAAPLNRPGQTMSLGQPPSPYQQRLPTAATYPPHPPSQASPPQPHPPSLPRHSGSTAAYDPVAHEAHRRSQSRGDRDRSLSISPKSQVPSLPGSASRRGTSVSVSDLDPRRAPSHPSLAMPSAMDHERERAVTPAKRKLEDRELPLDELEKREVRPPPFENANGRSAQIDVAPLSQTHVTAFRKPLKKRTKYSTPPVWSLPLQGRRPTHANITIYRPPQHAAQAVNGTPDGPVSRHTSPEERRAVPAPHTAPAAPPPQPAVPEPALPVDAQRLPWEPSVTGDAPRDAMSKTVADFLFRYVVMHPAKGEMESRKVQFEIEAKLGTLLDKSTGQRISLPCISESVLTDQGSWLGFKSSMSEDYHRSFNAFLNTMVQDAHPGNKDRPKGRMPIEYRHRREVDKFFELPDRERTRMLPACVEDEIASRNHRAKVRVTHDQKTDEVLAKIVKARVADLNLHFPEFPLDCRISVNLEMEWEGSIEELERLSASCKSQPQPNRGKDRLNYIHGPYQIDLTQVTRSSQGPGNTQRMEKEHEIEIEVNPQAILEHGRRAKDGQPNYYPDLVEGLINNVRVLARKALDFSKAQGR